MLAPDYTAIVERAAFLEFCCDVARPDADKQAVAEACENYKDSIPPGVLCELVLADRRRHPC